MYNHGPFQAAGDWIGDAAGDAGDALGDAGAGSTPPESLPRRWSGVNRGQREHKGSFMGYPEKGGGAVFY